MKSSFRGTYSKRIKRGNTSGWTDNKNMSNYLSQKAVHCLAIINMCFSLEILNAYVCLDVLRIINCSIVIAYKNNNRNCLITTKSKRLNF